MSINKLLSELSSVEISEWMAYDQLKDSEYKQKIESDLMTIEQRDEKLMQILGCKS